LALPGVIGLPDSPSRHPARCIPLAIQSRATVIEINPESNYTSDVTFALRGPDAGISPQLL
jgi:hypothetical protein